MLHLTTSDEGLRLEGDNTKNAPDGVVRALASVPAGAPVAVLIHGFNFDPSQTGRAAGRDPHSRLFGLRTARERKQSFDWPAELGFSRAHSRAGLCIGFGWPSRAPHLTISGRNGLAEAYRRAGEAGVRLSGLIAALHAARPDLSIDLFAHSLGARVALTAIGAPGVGRVILLGAAEYAAIAQRRLGQARAASVYNFISRQNDIYDTAFEALTPSPGDDTFGALGRGGLGARDAGWIDLQLDNPMLERWLALRGKRLAPADRPVCHCSFYSRPGVMALYHAILRDRPVWSIQTMRAAAAPDEIAPRWSRLRPRLGRREWLGRPTTA